jgi:hypothetical protein
MEQREPTPAVDRLAYSLGEWAGSGALVIGHMTRFGARGAPGEHPAEVFRDLLCMTLAPLASRHDPDDLELAADVLEDAVETLGEELLLVEPPDAPPPPPLRPRRPSCEF